MDWILMANRLMQVESRLDLINSITRKYGGQVDDVLEYFSQISKEFQLLTGSHSSSEDIEAELKELEKRLVNLAGQLSQARHTLAKQLESEIKQELQDLYMEKRIFKFNLARASLTVKEMSKLSLYFN